MSQSILIVEDDETLNLLITRQLAKAGYEATGVPNWSAAQTFLSDSEPALIISDVRLPDGDSLELLSGLVDTYPVIVLTAFGSVRDAVNAMKKGAADYLQKPIHFDELFLRLDKIQNLKMLIKNASDLREAMDITEKTSAETIQDLEIRVAELKGHMTAIRATLLNEAMDPEARIRLALKDLDEKSPPR